MNALREKLFEIIWDSVIKEAQKISKIPVGPNDALDDAIYDLEPCEWTQLHTRWKARLKKLGITRTSCKYLNKNDPNCVSCLPSIQSEKVFMPYLCLFRQLSRNTK